MYLTYKQRIFFERLVRAAGGDRRIIRLFMYDATHHSHQGARAAVDVLNSINKEGFSGAINMCIDWIDAEENGSGIKWREVYLDRIVRVDEAQLGNSEVHNDN